MKKPVHFATERELCSAFVDWLRRFPDWTPYPETAGWDLLLVHLDGTQIGVQAKLKLNIPVLCQAVEGYWDQRSPGPDFRAILVPHGQNGHALPEALGIGVFHGNVEEWVRDGIVRLDPRFQPSLGDQAPYIGWHYQNPNRRHELPRHVPDVPAGVPSPSTLSKWKIAALEIVAVLEVRGYVMREDFRLYRLDHRRWTQYWLQPIPGMPGAWGWKPGKADELAFDKKHPAVYPKILEEVRARLTTVLSKEGSLPL